VYHQCDVHILFSVAEAAEKEYCDSCFVWKKKMSSGEEHCGCSVSIQKKNCYSTFHDCVC